MTSYPYSIKIIQVSVFLAAIILAISDRPAALFAERRQVNFYFLTTSKAKQAIRSRFKGHRAYLTPFGKN
jgi:hypothetical protein